MIFPLLEVLNAVFIAISTVLDEFNYFSKLLKLKDDDGIDFFNVIMIDTVCRECKKLPREMHGKCDHLDSEIMPPWKSADKYKRSKILAQADHKKSRNDRESVGIISSDYVKAMNPEWVRDTFVKETRKMVKLKQSPKRLYMLIDPNAGGNSMMAVVTAFVSWDDMHMDPGSLVLLSLDWFPCKTAEEQNARLTDVYDKIRGEPLFQEVPIIVVPENQTGFCHQRIANMFRGEKKNCVCFHEGNGPNPGIRKDAMKTADYVRAANDIMSAKRLLFWEDWKTCNRKGKDAVANELYEQVARYCYDEHDKLTGKIGGANDDLCIGLLMATYWPRVIETSYKYRDYMKI